MDRVEEHVEMGYRIRVRGKLKKLMHLVARTYHIY